MIDYGKQNHLLLLCLLCKTENLMAEFAEFQGVIDDIKKDLAGLKSGGSDGSADDRAHIDSLTKEVADLKDQLSKQGMSADEETNLLGQLKDLEAELKAKIDASAGGTTPGPTPTTDPVTTPVNPADGGTSPAPAPVTDPANPANPTADPANPANPAEPVFTTSGASSPLPSAAIKTDPTLSHEPTA